MKIKHKFELIDGITTLRATIGEIQARITMYGHELTTMSISDELSVIDDQIAKLERIINEDDQLRDWLKDWESGLSDF